jgi:hypothetical protein
MRGGDERSGALFSYVDVEARVSKDHPNPTGRREFPAAGNLRLREGEEKRGNQIAPASGMRQAMSSSQVDGSQGGQTHPEKTP